MEIFPRADGRFEDFIAVGYFVTLCGYLALDDRIHPTVRLFPTDSAASVAAN